MILMILLTLLLEMSNNSIILKYIIDKSLVICLFLKVENNNKKINMKLLYLRKLRLITVMWMISLLKSTV